ncbi:MAG: hypothetical protein ACXAC7_15895 [Candidatus Hodarchaeales archaeon]|jgi:hypothetical protein
MAIFEKFSWQTHPKLLAEHEAVMEKYAFILKLLKSKIGKLVSFRYFSHMYGEGNSPLGGRMLLLEYESLQSYDEFQEKLIKREDYQGFQSAWSQVILPHTLRATLLSDRARGIWFNGQGTNVESD